MVAYPSMTDKRSRAHFVRHLGRQEKCLKCSDHSGSPQRNVVLRRSKFMHLGITFYIRLLLWHQSLSVIPLVRQVWITSSHSWSVLNFAFGIGWLLPYHIGSKRLTTFLFVISIGSKNLPMPLSHRARV